MYPAIKKVVAGKDYRLHVEFDNGESGTLDMSSFLDFGVFAELKDPNVFKQVHTSFDTVEWKEGIDLDPEFVYNKCCAKN